ncbi:MAG TPA: lasso RiPP family leader peptide-containing protein [Gemmatimonadaceae bacterium]
MYETPVLERYGTFRELTKIGKTGMMDQASVMNSDNTTNNDGCHGWTPTPSMTECYSG